MWIIVLKIYEIPEVEEDHIILLSGKGLVINLS
jgi:hypothetical protein